jgi:hypothetical protein
VQTGERILPHLLSRLVVGAGGKVVLKSIASIGFVGHATAGHLGTQQDTLVERHQLVVTTVEKTGWRQALQVIRDAVLVVWVTIDNSGALWLPVLR